MELINFSKSRAWRIQPYKQKKEQRRPPKYTLSTEFILSPNSEHLTQRTLEINNKGGRDPTKEETASIKLLTTPNNIRDSIKIEVITHPKIEKVEKVELEKVMETVRKCKGVVFNGQNIGKINCEPIHLEYESDFKPEQPRFRNVQINYQPKVSKLLDFLRKQDVIEDVDPKDNYDCVMNVVVTDKKNGSIRMKIDTTPLNHRMKRTVVLWTHSIQRIIP